MKISGASRGFVSLLLLVYVTIHLVVGSDATKSDTVAQEYPIHPVRIIEPYGAGGGPDLLARAMAPKLEQLWGQTVIVENHPGAGATAGPEQVARSPADGYTLLLNTSAQAYSAAALKNLSYNPVKDFIPIVPLTIQPYVLVAGASTRINNVHDLITAAKAKPGKLKFGFASETLDHTWTDPAQNAI